MGRGIEPGICRAVRGGELETFRGAVERGIDVGTVAGAEDLDRPGIDVDGGHRGGTIRGGTDHDDPVSHGGDPVVEGQEGGGDGAGLVSGDDDQTVPVRGDGEQGDATVVE